MLAFSLRDLAHNARGSGAPSLFGLSAHGTCIHLEDDVFVRFYSDDFQKAGFGTFRGARSTKAWTCLVKCRGLALCGETSPLRLTQYWRRLHIKLASSIIQPLLLIAQANAHTATAARAPSTLAFANVPVRVQQSLYWVHPNSENMIYQALEHSLC